LQAASIPVPFTAANCTHPHPHTSPATAHPPGRAGRSRIPGQPAWRAGRQPCSAPGSARQKGSLQGGKKVQVSDKRSVGSERWGAVRHAGESATSSTRSTSSHAHSCRSHQAEWQRGHARSGPYCSALTKLHVMCRASPRALTERCSWPVASHFFFFRCVEQLQRSRQQGHTQSAVGEMCEGRHCVCIRTAARQCSIAAEGTASLHAGQARQDCIAWRQQHSAGSVQLQQQGRCAAQITTWAREIYATSNVSAHPAWPAPPPHALLPHSIYNSMYKEWNRTLAVQSTAYPAWPAPPPRARHTAQTGSRRTAGPADTKHD